MKKLICLLLTAALLISVLVSAMVFSASADIVPTGYYDEETHEPIIESCPPEEYTEPCIETCAPEPEPTDCLPSEPTEPVAFADSDDGGKCGANAYWDYYNDGRLIVHGTGDVDGHSNNQYPWYKYRESIKTVIFEGVNNVPNRAFQYYNNLESVVIGDEIVSLGTEEWVSFDLPEYDYIVYPETFYHCENLKSVSLGNKLTSIEGRVFLGCNNLTEINFPDSLTKIGNSAFSDCTCLESITIPDRVSVIDYLAFSNCSSLKSVSLGRSVEEINAGAFYNCTELVNISFSDKIKSIHSVYYIDSRDGEDDIRMNRGAFENCTSLESVSLPDSILELGEFTFSNCESLKNVNLGSGIASIEAGTFDSCTNL